MGLQFGIQFRAQFECLKIPDTCPHFGKHSTPCGLGYARRRSRPLKPHIGLILLASGAEFFELELPENAEFLDE